jgi:hypothetical protein
LEEGLDKELWKQQYITLCVELLKMSRLDANVHYARAPEFDYGYSPLWYVKEEMNCEFLGLDSTGKAKEK